MSVTGRAKSVRIKIDNDAQNISSYTNAKLQLIRKSRVVIKLPPDDDIVCEFDLDDCSYIEGSSSPGQIECININPEQKTVIVIGPDKQCAELFDDIREYLENKPQRNPIPSPQRNSTPPSRRDPTPPPTKTQKLGSKPLENGKVNELVGALNNSNPDKAATIARELAEERQSIRFALDMTNESGDAQKRPPPPPVVEPLRPKVSIESFLIESNTDELYDVTIFPKTSVKDLKQMIKQNANIDPNQQYWYINRELLDDNYTFGVTPTPRVNNQTVLTLYIAKPPN